ncbi:hypothetical protein F0562_008666 [Nyssa sinensis]|uniref:NB-ARC domain-containing protein n=1 Tax=Nyssa sinensis TaxID=561372 RepID=A0A5J5A7P2_9ASTE|nr:hypothetical protein F0562_008666 [Nyssa sinensis]
MAEIAITVALFLAEEVLSSLDIWNLRKNLRGGVENLKTWLNTMQAYLTDMEGNEGNAVQQDRIKQVRNVAYDIEDLLDELMRHAPRRYHRHEFRNKAREFLHSSLHGFLLHEIPSKIKEIKTKIDEIAALDLVREPTRVGLPDEGSSSASSVERQVTPQILEDDEIFGFDEPKEKLVRQLTEGDSRRLTISVVGPAGSGKTVLVKNVYESKKVQGLFDSLAWVHVSRFFDIKKLVSSMLKQFGESTRERTPNEGADKESELRNYLQQKRYFLVLDDIWDINDWKRIQNVLPNGCSGSRIIVTTQKRDIASFCVESVDYVHTLNFLEWPEAWGLFHKKAFQTSNGKCPPELVDWAEKIVIKCEGSPLAIVAVSGLLSKKQQLPNEWKKLHDSLGSEIQTHSNLSIIRKVLLPSYKDLPSSHKSCFLYFSIFPQDKSIKRGKLIRLWVAEGFVTKKGGKTPEEVAEDHLNELIGRNLVLANNWDFDGRVSSCRVQNLVLEFLVSKSEDEHFVSILPEPNTSPGDKVRRLSIHNACPTLSQSKSFTSVRSTFLFTWKTLSPSHIKSLLDKFTLLKVLDLEDAPLDIFPEQIVNLTLLRYLSLRHTNIKVVPKSIKKLSNLETLDLKQTCVTELPERISLLRRLRHLLVYRSDVKNYDTLDSVQGVRMSPGIADLTNLQKLSLVKVDEHRKIIKQLGALTQLRKLGLLDLKREDGKDLCESIQNMQNLLTLDLSSISKEVCLDLDGMPRPPPHLQRLYLKGHLQKLPGWISSLNDLVRIGLQWSKLQHTPLEVLEQLPNLMELQMIDAFTGDQLVFEAERFKKLKILHIQQFDGLNMVVIQQGAMPELQKLTLWKCVNLKMLPLGIDSLTHLEELLLYDMPNEFMSRLRKTNEDQSFLMPLVKWNLPYPAVNTTWPAEVQERWLHGSTVECELDFAASQLGSAKSFK